jgi:cellulose biosynthesis protein BcsQ
MNIKYNKLIIIINRNRHHRLTEMMSGIKEKTGADLVIDFPDNIEIAEFAEHGKSLFNMTGNNEIVNQIDELIMKII